jgi:Primase C terminal 1 (PriCT-1)
VNDFWKVLFDRDEQMCFAKDVYGTALYPANLAHLISEPFQFFSINPLQNGRGRKDEHVTCYRNILLEFDHGSPAEQLTALTDVPHSTLVWSGGKSHHAIISLCTPCKDRAEYDALVRRIYAKLPMVDRSVKNPSRLSRVPNSVRDNENVQHLVRAGYRISQDELNAWLGPEPEKLKTEQPKMRSLHLSPWTKYFLMYGSETGQRNADLFKAACDMLRHGYSLDLVVDKAEEVLDLPRQEIIATVKSAQAAVRRST